MTTSSMVGRRIGRYLLNQEIGRGGMGVVYRATQVTLNRTVAIKMLDPRLATSREFLARFRREAETLSRLSHENIVHIYDVDEVEGSHFIAMEFVEGSSLTAILARQGALSPACARDIAAAIAGALGVAHRQGIVHRDIKPDNILVSLSGQAKLTDFGIAHMRDGRVETMAGVLLGTPYYMSPEQAGGRPISAGSDIYSLAVVLYEMVSGRVPFDAQDPLALALKHIQEAPPSLRRIAPHIPEPLVREVERALRKESSERHASAEEFSERLLSLDLGIRPGHALAIELATRSHPSVPRCPECATPIEVGFLTCPHCGLSIRHRCAGCSTLYDALSPACPVCNSPATPAELRLPVETVVVPPPAEPPAPVKERPALAQVATSEAPVVRPRPPAAPIAEPAPRPPAAPQPTREHRAVPTVQPALAVASAAAARAWKEIRRGADDLVLLGKQLRDRSGPPPTRRQFLVAGIATALAIAILLGIWQPWKVSLAAIPNLPPPGDVALSPASPAPGSSSSGSQTSRRVSPPVVIPDDSQESAAPPPAPAPTPGSGASQPSESGNSPSGSSAVEARTNAEAARRAIEEIIERQRLATESGNVDLLVSDLAGSLAGKAAEQLRTLHDSVTRISSRITRIRIDLNDDLASATVRFHARVTGIRRSTSQPLTVFDGAVRWALTRTSSRWVITSSSGA